MTETTLDTAPSLLKDMCQYQAICEEQVVLGRKVSPKPADKVSTLPPGSLPTDTGNQHHLFTPPPHTA